MAAIFSSYYRFAIRQKVLAVIWAVLIFAFVGHAHGSDWAYETGDLHAVWGTAIDDIFAVGKRGIILHYDGGRWIPMDAGRGDCAIDLKFEGIWGSSGSDVYAVGCYGQGDDWLWGCDPDRGTIFHYDGRQWTASNLVGIQPLYGVWGSSVGDVFAVGEGGTILHYDGLSWTAMASPTTVNLNGVWGTSGSDVFAVGGGGTILHFDGSDWTAMTSGVSLPLNAVWGTSATNVYAVGSSGTILRYDGSGWSPAPGSGTATTNALTGVWGSAASQIFALGNQGAIVFFDGNVWSSMPSNATADLKGLWGSSGSDIFAVGEGHHILNFNGSTWEVQSAATTSDLYDAWGTLENNVFAVGDNGAILHNNGAGWKSMVSNTNESLRAVWGSAVNDVYAVSFEGTIVHFDGSDWSTVYSDPESQFYDIWGSSGADIHVVGAGTGYPIRPGRIFHFDGGNWTTQEFEVLHRINGIWGIGPNDVFATTSYLDNAIILHFDGNTWSTSANIDKRVELNSIWGSASDNVQAVGTLWSYPLPAIEDIEMVQYDGGTWHSAPRDVPDLGPIDLHAIYGRSKSDLFAVGSVESGGYHGYAILRNTGGAWWLDRYNPTWHSLYGIWASPSGHVFAVGRGGVILRLVPEEEPAVPGPLWARTLGETGIDKAHAVAPTRDGGSIAAGQTDSIGAGGSDVWVVRLDPAGNLLWHKALGGPNDDRAASIIQTTDGGYILAGHTFSFGAGTSDAWVIKLDPDGNVEWENAYGGLEEDSVSVILETGSCSEGYAYAVLGTTWLGAEEREHWILKLDATGGVLWKKTYPIDGMENLVSLARGKGYGFFLSGKSDRLDDGYGDFLVLRVDDEGNVLWGKTFGLMAFIAPGHYNINIESEARVIVGEDGGPLLAGKSSPSHGSPYTWGVKLNALGTVEWQYIYSGDVDISAVSATSDRGFIIGGDAAGDGRLMKLDNSGTLEWTGFYRGYDSGDQEAVTSVRQTPDGGFLASGWTTSLTPGEEDFWVLRLNESGLIPGCAGVSTWSGGGFEEETTETGTDLSVTAIDSSVVVTPTSAATTAEDIIEGNPCLFTVSDLIDLPRTGQTIPYHAGDDGHIQAGAPWPVPRFVDNGDGTVTDDLTGLIWLKDGACLGAASWQNAIDSIAAFNADPEVFACTDYNTENHQGDWRVPNINEIESLVNVQVQDLAVWLNGQGFVGVVADWYWSSSTPATTYRRWSLDMGDGMPSSGYGPLASFRVWSVRGGQRDYWNPNFPANVWKTGQTLSFYPGDDGDLQMGVFWPSPRFEENGDGTVTDNLTGLVWLRDTYCFADADTFQINNWQDGLTAVADFNINPEQFACAEYDLGNHQEGWRVPNIKELLSLMDRSKSNPAIPAGHPFLNVSRYNTYWSSTTYPNTSPSSPTAWIAYPLSTGSLFTVLKNHGGPTVWPVRGEIHANVLRDADFDGDGDVDGRDIVIIADAFGYQWFEENFDPRVDMVADGIIDSADLEAFAPHVGRTDCPCHM